MSKRNSTENAGKLPDRLKEPDVFITKYLNASSKFFAIVKQRYSDFQVNEIDLDGQIVHLTSLDEDISNEKEEPAVDLVIDDVDVTETPVAELEYPLDSDEKWRQLSLLLKRNKREDSIRMMVTNVSKSDRTLVHKSVEDRYHGKLITSTVTEGEQKYIVIGTNKNVDRRNICSWPKNLPQYLHFVLYKENTDTINAVRSISKSSKVSQNCLSYAGTKDRRGVTTQRMCAKRLTAKRLSSLRFPRMWLGNFEYKERQLNLGDLKGNRFLMALRQVESTEETLETTLFSLKEKGFINYYGLQRFGSYSAAPTYEIGRYLICQQWKEAVDLILKPRPDELQLDIQLACKVWSETKNATKAVKHIKRDFSTEATVLRTLAQQGNTAFVNALQKVPRNILLLYLHSFQSLIWNRIVSRRIDEFGLKVLPGDLVFADSSNISASGDAEDDSVVDAEEGNRMKEVKVISEEELSTFSVYDLVYPLPGYAVKYPENATADWYKEIMSEYGVSSFDGKNKMFTVSGDYRKMLVLPGNMSWNIVHYDNPNADLIATDLQKLKNQNTVESVESGSYKAIILQFDLPSSTYATMAIRELTKDDTSSSHQATLTADHVQNKKAKLSE